MAKEYLKSKFDEFINSFKTLDRTLLYIVVYKLVFYIAIVISYNKFASILQEKSGPILAIASSSISHSAEVLSSQAATLKGFLFSMLGYLIFFVIILYIIYTLMNLFIWSTITRTKLKKSSKNFIMKFFGLNLIWLIGWIVVIFLLLMSLRKETVPYWFAGVAFVYSHLTVLLYIAYFKRKKISRSLKSAFNTGFAKLHKFIIPYILAVVVFAIVNAVFTPIGTRLYTGVNTVFLIAFLFYAAWLRIYIYSFAKKLV